MPSLANILTYSAANWSSHCLKNMYSSSLGMFGAMVDFQSGYLPLCISMMWLHSWPIGMKLLNNTSFCYEKLKPPVIIFEGLEFANPLQIPRFIAWLPVLASSIPLSWKLFVEPLAPICFLFLVTYTLGRNMKNCYLAFLKRHSQLGWKDELRGSAILFDHLVSAWDSLQKKILREWGCKLTGITVTLFYVYVFWYLI